MGETTLYIVTLEDNALETGAALIMLNQQNGQNMIMVLNGACNHITNEDVCEKQALIEKADYLLVQMEINIDALEHVIHIAHNAGVKVILNPAPVQKISDDVMALIDTVTPNETEAHALTGIEVVDLATAHKAAQVFFDKGVRNVIITLGSAGVYCSDGKQEELIERIHVHAVDTTGTGDAFNGGFVTALSKGKSLFEAVRYHGNQFSRIKERRLGSRRQSSINLDIALPEDVRALYCFKRLIVNFRSRFKFC